MIHEPWIIPVHTIMVPIHAHVYIKISLHTKWTTKCFGQPCDHHQGCKVQRSDTLKYKIKLQNYQNQSNHKIVNSIHVPCSKIILQYFFFSNYTTEGLLYDCVFVSLYCCWNKYCEKQHKTLITRTDWFWYIHNCILFMYLNYVLYIPENGHTVGQNV
jgi:hypothetical protein